MRKNANEELLQNCVSKEEGEKILKEIHAGTCGNHVASTTLVGKAFRAGFYWPLVVTDVEALVHPLRLYRQFLHLGPSFVGDWI